MNPVCPFDLSGVEQQMEQAVEAKQQKDAQGASGGQGQGRCQEQTEEEGGLIQTVEPQGVWINARNKLQHPLGDPGDIRDDASQQHPLGTRPFAKQAVQRPLDADVGKGVGHGQWTIG